MDDALTTIELPSPPAMLSTKVTLPSRPIHLVPRQRLLATLEAACRVPLTLVCAPAGFGKTTLVVEWLCSLNEGPADNRRVAPLVAWLSLDEGDNDVVQFLLLLIAAIQRVKPGVGAEARALLQANTQIVIEVVLRMLLHELAQSSGEHDLLLVLDDYHLVQEPAIHKAMRALIEHLPHGVRMMLITRVEPPLPLARWRVQDRMYTIEREQLRFTASEATHFFATGLPDRLEQPAILTLVERTEGWVAGLHLAALTLREAADVPQVLAAFGGAHRFVAEYLIDEVVGQQPQEVQTFLLRTSILDRLCAPVCAAMIDDTDDGDRELDGTGSVQAQQVLEQIERSNVFLLPLDAQRIWYRYHHLFGELLRHHLQTTQPMILPTLHRRASAWHAQAAALSASFDDQLYHQRQAVRHVLAAGDHNNAASFVEQVGVDLVAREALRDLASLIELIPHRIIRDSPRLSLWYASHLMFSGQVDQGESYLREVERSLEIASNLPPRAVERITTEMRLLRSRIAHVRGDAVGAIALARDVVAQLPAESVRRRCRALESLGRALFSSGAIAAAGDTYAAAREVALDHADHQRAVSASGMLIETYLIRGALPHAAGLGYQTLEMAERLMQRTKQDVPGADYVAVCVGAIAYQRNDLDRATALVEQGMRLGRRFGNIGTLLRGEALLAELAQARGEHDTAQQAMHRVITQVGRLQTPPSLRALCTLTYTRLCLANGERSAAEHWLNRVGFHRNVRHLPSANLPLNQEVFLLAFARLLIASGAAHRAVEVLTPLAREAEQAGRNGHLMLMLVLLARALNFAGTPEVAVETMQRVLLLAEPEGYERLFVDEDADVDGLLLGVGQRQSPESPLGRYVQHLLDVRSPTRSVVPPVILMQPLTPRELEVVRLLALGQSNRQIAERLYVTTETIKQHLKHLYGKLEVHNRTAAVARARALHLLD